MVRRETCLLGMDCDKGQFSLEKFSHVIIGSHLSPMESSNLKMTFHLFLSLELAKKINTQHCYKQLVIYLYPLNIMAPTNEGCQKKSQHKNELPN